MPSCQSSDLGCTVFFFTHPENDDMQSRKSTNYIFNHTIVLPEQQTTQFCRVSLHEVLWRWVSMHIGDKRQEKTPKDCIHRSCLNPVYPPWSRQIQSQALSSSVVLASSSFSSRHLRPLCFGRVEWSGWKQNQRLKIFGKPSISTSKVSHNVTLWDWMTRGVWTTGPWTANAATG